MLNQFTASIWGDEGFSAILSMKPLPELIKIIARDTSPPLYNISEHIWFRFFGTSEVAIRGLSFFYFLIAVFFTYKIGSLLWNKKTGILAASLTFLNPFFFIYAFEGRMYSILAASVVASMYFFLRKNWVGYVLATTAALYSHHFSIFAIFVQGIWFLKELITKNWKLVTRILRAFIAVAVLYSPWLIPLYKQTRMVGGGFWLGTPTPSELVGLIFSYLAAGITSSPFQIPLVRLKIYMFALISVLVALAVRRWRAYLKETLFLVFWFLFPILTVWGISQFFQSIFFNRYLLYTIPAAMLLIASNLRGLISKLLIALIILLFAIIDFHYFTHPTKLPFRDLASYVKTTKKEGDFLINWNSKAHHLWETKYYEIPAPIYIPTGGDLPFFVGTALMEKNDVIKELPKKVKRIGVVTSGHIDEIYLPGYTEGEAKSFSDLKFIWYEKR